MRHSLPIRLFAALLLAAPLPVAAFAQASATPAAVSVAASRPDVQIVVLVLPTGSYAVSSVYPTQVPQAAAQARIARLLKLTGWHATNRRFSDVSPDAKRSLVKLSAASFETGDAVIGTDGTVDWEPFLRAFGDVRRVNVACFTPANWLYKGATQFDSPRLSLTVTPVPGSVTLAAAIKQPALDQAPFGVPSADALEPAPSARHVARSGTASGSPLVIGALLAAVSAALLYFSVSRLLRKP